MQWVQLGTVNRAAKGEEGQRIRVAARIPHPDYKRPLHYNVIALLRLERAADMSAAVRPACLQTEPGHGRAGDMLVATGWGSTTERKH